MRAASILDGFSRRVVGTFAPLRKFAESLSLSYGRLIGATNRMVSAMRSAADSLAKIAAGVGSGGGAGGAIATAGAVGAVEGAASVASSAAMSKLLAGQAASSAATAVSFASISASVGSVTAALSAAVPYVAAIAAAGAAIYAAWQLLEPVWPAISKSIQVAGGALSTVVTLTLAMVNPLTYIRGGYNLIVKSVSLLRDGVVATASATRTLLVGAVNVGVAAWQRLSGLVTATASRVASVLQAAGRGALAVGQSVASGMRSAASAVADLLERVSYAAVVVGGLSAAIVGPLTAAANRAGEAGAAVDKLAQRAGISAQAMSELAYAAETVGVSASDVSAAVEKVGGEDRFLELGNSIAQIADPAQRSAAAVEAFGSSGAGLMALFERGPGELARLRAEAEKLGVTFSGPAAASATALARSHEMLKAGLRGLWQTIGQAIMPQITDWNNLLIGAIQGVVRWVKANQPLIAQVFRIAEAVGMAAGFVAALAAGAVKLTPALLGLTAAAGAGGAIWLRFGEQIQRIAGPVIGVIRRIYDEASRVFAGIGDAVRAGNLELAIEIAWLGAQAAWTKGLMSLASVSNDTFAGIFNSMATGDWKSAGTQAWSQVQIAFEQGMGKLEQLWSSLKSMVDGVATSIQQSWNTAIQQIGVQLDKLLAKAIQVFDALNAYDPTDATKAIRDGLAAAQNRTGWMPGEDANQKLQQGLDQRNADRQAEANRRQAERDARIAELRATGGAAGAGAGQAASDRMSELQRKLDEALKAAADARAKADEERRQRDKINGQVGGAAAQGQQGNGGLGATFSAAALLAMAGRAPTRTEQLQQQQLVKLDRQIEQTDQLIKAVSLEYTA